MEEGNPLYLDLLGSGDELSFYPYNGCYPKGEYQLAGGGSPERYDEELLLSALCFSQPTRCPTNTGERLSVSYACAVLLLWEYTHICGEGVLKGVHRVVSPSAFLPPI